MSDEEREAGQSRREHSNLVMALQTRLKMPQDCVFRSFEELIPDIFSNVRLTGELWPSTPAQARLKRSLALHGL